MPQMSGNRPLHLRDEIFARRQMSSTAFRIANSARLQNVLGTPDGHRPGNRRCLSAGARVVTVRADAGGLRDQRRRLCRLCRRRCCWGDDDDRRRVTMLTSDGGGLRGGVGGLGGVGLTVPVSSSLTKMQVTTWPG